MKHALSFLSIVLIGTQAIAQFSIGTHAGVDFNNIQITGIPETLTDLKQNTSFAALGVHGAYGLTPSVAIKAELNYSKKGFEIDQTINQSLLGINIPIGIKAKTSLAVVESPILVAFTKPTRSVNLFIEGGPVFSYTSTGKIEPVGALGVDFNLPDIPIEFSGDGYNRMGVGGALGFGISKDLNEELSIFGRTRYTHSFTDLLDNPIIEMKTRANTVHLGIGISYTL